MRIAVENVRSADATSLLRALTSELAARYPEEDSSGGFQLTDVEVPGSAFVIARDDTGAAGCGAIRPFPDHGVAEVKRMFVIPERRGMGVAKRILLHLERTAIELGYVALILETGVRQPEAVRLYESMGYRKCTCWDEYRDNPFSVCYRKDLRLPATAL